MFKTPATAAFTLSTKFISTVPRLLADKSPPATFISSTATATATATAAASSPIPSAASTRTTRYLLSQHRHYSHAVMAATQSAPSPRPAGVDDQHNQPPTSPTGRVPAAKPASGFFPLGYKDAAFQWWHSVTPTVAERNVIACIPYLREAVGSTDSFPSADHPGAIQSSTKVDPFGPRVWKSMMVPLSGRNRQLNEFSVERVGEDIDNTLVMLHGYGAGLGFYYKNFEPLTRNKGWKLYALDMLGMGNSSRPSFKVHAKSPSDKIAEAEGWFVDALEEWRKIRKIEKFTLMGHSLGGYLAVSYALKYPGHLNKLILVSPVGIPEDPYAVNAELPEPQESTFQDEFTVDQQTTTTADAPAAKKRPYPTWLTWLWDANVSPFSIVRLTGPIGPRLVSGWTSRRFNHLPEEERQTLHDYAYSLFRQAGSGEYALPYLLAPGAHARRPVINRVHGLGRQTITPATPDGTPAVKETGFPVVFMYGENDWMDVKGGLASEERLKLAKEKALKQATEDERRRENGSAKVLVVTKAGHHLYLDNPDEFNDYIKAELNETRRQTLREKARAA